MNGSFNPICSFKAAMASAVAFSPRIRRAGLPGIKLIIEKIINEMPTITGIIKRSLFAIYLCISLSYLKLLLISFVPPPA